jgi:hypothetical protein
MAGINVFDPRAYLVAMAFFAAVVALQSSRRDAAPFLSTQQSAASMSSRHDRFGMPPWLIDKTPASSRQVAAYQAQTLLRSRWIVRFDAHSIVDGKAQFLLAAEVPFRRLDRDVSKQKLDLVQLATETMAESRAAASIMPHAA